MDSKPTLEFLHMMNISVSLKLTYRMVERLMKISGEVEGCDCILVDDMIDTGSTMQLALDVLRAHGAGLVI